MYGLSKRHSYWHEVCVCVCVLPPALYHLRAAVVEYGDLCCLCCAHLYSAHILVERIGAATLAEREASARIDRVHSVREMGGAPRNPAPGNLCLVWIVKPSGCHCTYAFGGKDIVECRPLSGALPLSLIRPRSECRQGKTTFEHTAWSLAPGVES